MYKKLIKVKSWVIRYWSIYQIEKNISNYKKYTFIRKVDHVAHEFCDIYEIVFLRYVMLCTCIIILLAVRIWLRAMRRETLTCARYSKVSQRIMFYIKKNVYYSMQMIWSWCRASSARWTTRSTFHNIYFLFH